MPASERLGVFLDDAGEEVRPTFPEEVGVWEFTEADYLLYSLLADNVECVELLWEDPLNREYGGTYHVRDYQYPLFRGVDSSYEGYACARSVGKTESVRARAFTHAFRRLGQGLLLTAPELIHLLPLTDAIEDRITRCRLTRDFLDTDGGRTGFTHRPFGVDFKDGTQIVGRIPRQSGPQPVDTPVLTPAGWTRMGELRPGDSVIGSEGTPIEVLATTNTWESDVFEVEFTDGSTTRADGCHRWRVKTDSGVWQILNTNDLATALLQPAKRSGTSGNMYRVVANPIVTYAPGEELPVDPYVLGVILGDGSISQKSARLTGVDPEIFDHIRERLPRDHSLTLLAGIDYLIVGPDRHKPNLVLRGLKALGLMGTTSHTKFIPEVYLRASVEDRLDLLRGLLDADGTVKDSGGACLISASSQLVEGAVEIVRSLGGWGSSGLEHKVGPQLIQTGEGRAYHHPGGTYYRATLRIQGMNLFFLPRKAEKYRLDGKQRHRSIRGVTPAGRAQVMCIKVDVEDETYLTEQLIPTLNTGVKGMHVPDLIVDEAQNYPEAGWVEVHEVVMKDTVDQDGNPDFSYLFYGVHSGARDTGFAKRASSGGFKITQVTAMQRPGWGAAEKAAAIAAYGGTAAPDYRRNILGEAGGASSPLFNTARLIACMDQDRESTYNTQDYKFQEIRVEHFDRDMLPIEEVLDLPSGLKTVWGGCDLGLTNSPTVITLFNEQGGRLRLVRRIHLERMRVKTIRFAIYAIFRHFGDALKGFGIDETGLGFPIFQEIEDDELKPQFVGERFRGYFFNSKVAVGLERGVVAQDGAGGWKDQYGSAVELRKNPLTNEDEYIVYMPMIEASTRYLRTWVDSTYLELPFDPAVIGDLQGETNQRVKRIAGLKNKPNAFHILDAFRACSMVYKHESVEAAVALPAQEPVLDFTF